MDCIICKLISGEFPSYKVYEDDDFLAILDISQATKGHTFVFPKKHYANIFMCPDDLLEKINPVIKKIILLLKEKLDAKGFNVLSNCGSIAGQSIEHFHFHIIPRYEEDDVTFKMNEHNYDLAEVLKEIKE